MIRETALIALLASPAVADVDRVSFMLGSHHEGGVHSFEEVNPGIFLTWEDVQGTNFDVTTGVYSNSFGDTSVSLTASYDVIEWDNGAIAAFAGAAYYPAADVIEGGWKYSYQERVMPLVGIQARHGNLYAQIMPLDKDFKGSVVATGFTFEVSK